MNTIIRTQDDALTWAAAQAASLNEGRTHADEVIPVLGAAGFFRIGVPVELGGTGGSTWDAAEAIARVAEHSLSGGLRVLGAALLHRLSARKRQRGAP